MSKQIYGFLLFLDGIIYNVVTFLYEIFLYLAKTNFFDSSDYNKIVGRLYIILGVVMLFILAYTLLKAVVNPEEFSKGDKSFANLAKNIVVSLIIIAVLPMIFTFVFNVQNSIISYGTIQKLFMFENVNSNGTLTIDDENLGSFEVDGGRTMAFYTFQAFLTPKDGDRSNIHGNGELFVTNGQPLSETDKEVLSGNGANFINYTDYSEEIVNGRLIYYFPISTIAGIFLGYVLLNFCFDMALRVIKLGFYQIIAPIPVICRIIPGGKMKDVFSKWVKQIVSLFAEVFIRIAAMSLGVFLIQIIISKFNSNAIPGILSSLQAPFVLALLILSIVMFVKQIPKLIGDMFGIDTGGMKLGLKEKLSQSGAFTAGAFIGGGLGSAARNVVARGRGGWTKSKEVYNNAGGGLKGRLAQAKSLAGTGINIARSGTAGAISGAFRAGAGAKNAKSFKDMTSAIGKATDTTARNRANRDRYIAQNGRGVMNHIEDAVTSAAGWVGISNNLDDLKQQQEFNKQIIAIDDNSDSVAVELLGRDYFKNSAEIMKSASKGTYELSFGAMQERITQAQNTDFKDVKGTTILDFKGDSHTITDENEYAKYMAEMRSQLAEAERNAKKYIKEQGYRGTAGIAELELITKQKIEGGELQRINKLYSDRQNIENIVKESQAAIAEINKGVAPDKQVFKIEDGATIGEDYAYDLMDKLTNSAKNSNIAINAEMERLRRESERRHPDKNGH